MRHWDRHSGYSTPVPWWRMASIWRPLSSEKFGISGIINERQQQMERRFMFTTSSLYIPPSFIVYKQIRIGFLPSKGSPKGAKEDLLFRRLHLSPVPWSIHPSMEDGLETALFWKVWRLEHHHQWAPAADGAPIHVHNILNISPFRASSKKSR